MRRKHSNVPIVDVNSPSALRTRSFSNPKAILTSPNVAPNAVRQGNHSGTKAVATAIDHVRCSLRFVLSVASKLKYRSSHAKTDQCIAAIATVK